MASAKIRSYRDLIVWQQSVELVTILYELTQQFPKEELYGLTSQLRRSAVSIPSNIADGKSRKTKKDYIKFLNIAYASGAELETQIEVAKRLPRTKDFDYRKISSLLFGIMKMLNVLIKKLQDSKKS